MLLTNLISVYLLSVTIAVVFSAVYIRTLSGAKYTRTAMLLCFAVCVYILGYTMELNSSIPSQLLIWNRIEYIGIPFVSALWLTTALIYTGHFMFHRKVLLAAIFVIPFITMILRFTNEYHGLYFASSTFLESGGRLAYVKQSGPWLYVQLVHSAAMIFTAMGLLISDCFKRAERQNGKILVICAASVFAVAGLILSQIKPFGVQIDYMALCLPVTCVLVIVAISRYDLLEAKAVARAKAFAISSDSILLINSQNRVLDYNRSAQQLFSSMNIRLGNGSLLNLFGKEPGFLEGLGKAEPTVVRLKINGEDRYYGITTETIDIPDKASGWIKTIRDVSQIYQLNEELKKQAMTDELSALSNRRAFIKIGSEWIAETEDSGVPLHLVMMDLDRFKDVNDQFGHPTGDSVIREFAQMLKNHFPPKSLVARLGGEEFAVMLMGCSDDDTVHVVTDLLTCAAQHQYNYMESRFSVTVSVGITKKQPGQSLDDMMRKADRALYQSKERGSNTFTVL